MDIDVHSYQDELDQIVNDARAVLARMDEMKHRMDAVAMRVDQVEHALAGMKTEIDGQVQGLAQDIEAFLPQAQEKLDAFDSAGKEAYQQAVNDLLQKIASMEALFTEKSGHAIEAVDQSHTVVQQMRELVIHADHDVADGVRGGVHLLTDNIADFRQQFDGTTHPALATLDDALAHVHDQAEQHAHEAHDHIAQLRQATDEHLQQELFSPMHQHVEEAARKLSQIASGDVDGKLHELMDHTREQLENQAKHVIDQLLDKVGQELDQVSDHIHQAGQHSAIPREAMKPILDSIEGLLKPVEETIGNVKSIAAAVGFDV